MTDRSDRSDRTLGERELDVMGVLWGMGSGTVAEVRDRLPASLAYTTVLTILRNLEAKGFVRHDAEGKAHRYLPLVAPPPARPPPRHLGGGGAARPAAEGRAPRSLPLVAHTAARRSALQRLVDKLF